MSSVVGDSNLSICARCGKSGDNLKACTACHLVKYCNRNCQILHRPKHKKECKQRAAELQRARDTSNSNVNDISGGISNASISDTSTNDGDKKVSTSYEQNNNSNSNVDNEANTNEDLSRATISDEELFKDPPPKEECPICMQPMPFENGIFGVDKTYKSCCGKVLCHGCIVAESEEMMKGNLKDLCAFCRVPMPSTDREIKKRLMKRVEINDAEALLILGDYYRDGDMGLPQNNKKALEFFLRAAEHGSCRAHHDLSNMYYCGEVVKKDMKKAILHCELAAVRGHEVARNNLGAAEEEKGNVKRAMKHYIIAARSGYDLSLKAVGDGYKAGLATKDEYAKTLRAYQNIRDEMKSEQRTKAWETEEAIRTIMNR